MTQCSPANVLEWVNRIFTRHFRGFWPPYPERHHTTCHVTFWLTNFYTTKSLF
jgi:hypothetical protein